MRRRARFLRKARELAYRDLGGLVFSLHRFGQRNDPLVLAKLSTLSQIDAELRALESALEERQPLTVLREAGITACPRCAAIHGGEDRFCPNCGLPISRRVDLPIAGPAAATSPTPPAGAPSRSPTPTPAPSPRSTPERAPTPGAPTAPKSGAAIPGTARPAAPPESAPGAVSPPGAPEERSASEPAPADAGSPGDDAGRGSGGRPAPGAGAGADGEEPTEIVRPRSGSA